MTDRLPPRLARRERDEPIPSPDNVDALASRPCGLWRRAPPTATLHRMWMHIVVDRRGRGHVRHLPAHVTAH